MDFLDAIGAVVGGFVRLFGWLLMNSWFVGSSGSEATPSSPMWRNLQAIGSWVRVLFWLALAVLVCWALWQLPS